MLGKGKDSVLNPVNWTSLKAILKRFGLGKNRKSTLLLVGIDENEMKCLI
jgi:hypothetical protein